MYCPLGYLFSSQNIIPILLAASSHNRYAVNDTDGVSIIIKEINQLEIAIQENPFDNTYDSSRIHLVFTNEEIPESTLTELSRENFGDEEFYGGHECCYLYLPRDARKKRLNTNYLERKFGIRMTMRKLSVVNRLSKF